MSQAASAKPSAIPDSRGTNLFDRDPAFDALLRLYLPEALHAHLLPILRRLGRQAGGELDRLAASADRNPPVLAPRTRGGADIDSIEKHPDYVALERVAYSKLGLAAMSHRDGVLGWSEPLPAVAKYALTFLFVQAEFGLCCPVSMTDSLTRTLRKFGAPDLVARFLPQLTSQDFDQLYQGAMFMTEQDAGSDVGGVATRAHQDGGQWRLTGDKWFCSNTDAELAMVLARPDGAPKGIKGLGLFLLPRTLPDGSRNHYRIIRLKDKLGTRSMASGEIRLDGAIAYPVGDLTRGFKQMADMINMSRLSNGVRSAGLMRRAYSEAHYVASHREAFGKRLMDMPLMRRQLIKMLLPGEQARSMFLHTAQCLAQSDAGDARAGKLLRIMTPLIKFRACRDARKVTGDALEVRGGCGYIEEWVDARLVRDSHLGSVWEGTSNIVALDVMRAATREDALTPLRVYLEELLDAPGIPAESRVLLQALLSRAAGLADAVARDAREHLARQAASALYHVTSAIIMAWEAARQAPDWRRLALAHLVARFRLSPVDPLDDGDADALDPLMRALLADEPISAALARDCLTTSSAHAETRADEPSLSL
ncbi:MAG TPA: acyl-CoA dehydrogenase family protein [Burkholderiaceae bacterium]|nr:acyl-CoA dehydrogenase family protein [Burkholderiaceae bacterium]